MKEKRKREREVVQFSHFKLAFITFAWCTLLTSVEQKNLPRKKRRKLEAAREMLEDQSEMNESEVCISSFIGNQIHF